jgi:hypothetical protein
LLRLSPEDPDTPTVDPPEPELDEDPLLDPPPPLSRDTAVPVVFPFDGREPSWAQTGRPASATTPEARVKVPKSF